jgi:FtsP/CotA-like multicopper oxidase with cupredoxin domain
MKVKKAKRAALAVLASLMLLSATAWAANDPVPGVIDGVSGPAFTLTAKAGYISTPVNNSIYVWGFADGDGAMQYPGPTLIVNQGEAVTIDLTNTLPGPTSIVFPGQTGVTATMVSGTGTDGLLTKEADTGETVRYAFTADNPGTYIYHSGTAMDLQVEMGLVGALIVRPANFDPTTPRAYNHPATAYDVEYLFLLTEMDLKLHRDVELGRPIDTTAFFPTQWFINGRAAPDTMFPPYADWLPNQPYNCMPMTWPGKKLLMRVIGAGRDMHPFHQHGNHARVIARDGRLLESGPELGPDLSHEVFTVKSVPGQTVDAVFSWTGAGMGWDIYGHGESDPMEPEEYAPDHGKPFPVLLPEALDLAYGGFWSGSPFLGAMGSLPPGEGGLNPGAGFAYMWHSHTEKEMVNNDIFPGGMMTMLIVLPPEGAMEALPLEQDVNPFFHQGGN